MQWLGGILVAMLLLSACSGSSSPSSSQGTTTAYVPPLPAISGLPAAALQGQLTGALPLDQTLQLTIGLQVDRNALAQAALDIHSPTSSRYGRYLSPQQVAAQFGASQQTVQTVSNWFTSQGFQVVGLSPLRNTLTVQASVLQIAKAFQVVLQLRALDGQTFFGPSQAPVLPAQISSLVTSITGLDNFARFLHKPPQDQGRQGASLSGLSASQPAAGQRPQVGDCTLYGLFGLTRDQLAQAYGVNQLYKKGYKGQGMTVGVVELGEPYSSGDVGNYSACNGGQLHVRNVEVDGRSPTGSGAGEAALDLELISGLAPDAQLLDYIAPTPDDKSFLDVMNKVAADDQVQVLSISYGEGEDQTTPSYMAQFEQTLEVLAVEGISVFIASGDCAAYVDGVFGQLQVSFPASAPWATAVGGTILNNGKENAWSSSSPDKSQCQNTWGTGGGVSQNHGFPRPPWQVGTGVQNSFSNGNRQVPDVAAAADNIAIYYQGVWMPIGGTSAAAPIWAAGATLVDQVLKKEGKPLLGGVSTLYQIANHPGKLHPFHDVTQGNNIYYKAGTGWDYPTGWGTPNFPDIARLLGATV